MRGKIIAAIAGIILLLGYLFTANGEISNQDKDIYQEAVSLQKKADEIGFPGFSLSDYPVAMYDGTNDYVFYQGTITKRAPVLQTFVGTAYPVDGHFEVIVPTLERLNGLLSIAGGVEGMVSGSGYKKEEQISTIWHEGFHAWQLTNFQILGEKIDFSAMSENDQESDDNLLLREVDGKAERKENITQEMKLLKNTAISAVAKGNIDGIKKSVLEYKKLVSARRKNMGTKAVRAEQRMELTEGSAYYVESKIYQLQKGEKAYQKQYIETLDKYEGGRGKYYRIGMVKCILLDELNPGWKLQCDFSKSLDELLEDALK